MRTAVVDGRAACRRCWRPLSHCCCRGLAPVATRTRLVILQHPRERTMKIGTARLAHLCLADSELHVGIRFDDHPRVRELAAGAAGHVALLYPDPAGGSGPAPPVDTLVVVDGTWSTARKMIARSPLLRGLPRLALVPRSPSTYRIRREPAAHCLSTLEAIVQALEILEGDGRRFAPLLAAFGRMVDLQLEHAARAPEPYRHERKRRRPRRPSPTATLLATHWPALVLAQAEGNPHDHGGPHELVQLVAARPATGERFATLVRPRHRLAPATPRRLGLDPEGLLAGVEPGRALADWTRFLRPGDVLAGWGGFTPAVLTAEGAPPSAWVDLKAEVGRRLGRTGGVEAAARELGTVTPPPLVAPGRGGIRLQALESVAAALRDHPPSDV